jgi:hypothetical protein
MLERTNDIGNSMMPTRIFVNGASDMRDLEARHGGLRRISIHWGVVPVARSVMSSASTTLTWTKVNRDVNFKARDGQNARS